MGDNRDSRRDSHEGMRRGQRPDGSKVYGGWLYLYLGVAISNGLRDPHDAVQLIDLRDLMIPSQGSS